jgi:pimeloyl-ACP methyl ester carboxylesterase
VGLYHPPAEGHLTWVFLSGLGSSKEEWKKFADLVVAQGNGAFLYDFRGHGESRQGPGGEIDFNTAAEPFWSLMPDDLKTVLHFLSTRCHIPLNRTGLAGASLGANVVLNVAADNGAIPAVVLLSPGFVYAGISTQDSFGAYGRRPMFAAASPEDKYAYATVSVMAKARQDGAFTRLDGRGREHGVAMLHGEFTDTLLRWMKGFDGNRNSRSSQRR